LTPIEEALRSLVEFLEREKVPYMLVGALAGLAWGLRRATFDVDLTVWAGDGEDALAARLSGAFRSRAPDPRTFVRDTGVLPIEVGGVHADIIFGRLPYEESAIRRAPVVPVSGLNLRVCSAEDLIVHKIVSERPRDLEDVKDIIQARGKTLDRAYLDPIVRALSHDLSRREIQDRYLGCFGLEAGK